ncbi:MAG: PLP-dependent aminotransferase family protein [Thermoanaerobaculales bacterium]|nr:PLP-dependent aminotransferase family protein [Thermoanaerobaculales bacterium]
MTLELASRMAGLKASEIREILKLTQREAVISFAGGLPAVETFPAEDILSVSAEVLTKYGTKALQYSPTEGFPALRDAIAGRMNRNLGTRVQNQEILVTSGSQQGLELTGKLMLDDGDVVLCESPTYLGAISAFNAFQPRFVEVATDDDGLVVEDLERCLKEIERVKFVYVVPDFQNPSGRTWSLERRQGVMELIRRFEVPIIEDCPYAEVRFEGNFIPPLKSMEGQEWVVFLGTFSKIFCPGMRIGWLAAAPDLYKKYVLAKQGADLHTSTLGQMQLAAYLEKFDIEKNIEGIIDLYRARRDTMLDTMTEEFPPGVSWTHPQGGMFLWVHLPEGMNAAELLVDCLKEDVAFVPGAPFFPNGGHENTLRMNFSFSNPEKVKEGVKRMAKVLRKAMENR